MHTWRALPVRLSSFVGRESEVHEILGRLGESRLVTLTGPGGCGKTRLALEVARRRPGDVVWVDLGQLTHSDTVELAVGYALGVRPLPSQTDAEVVWTHLADRADLVVLDNCEHVVDAVREFCRGLLTACPGVRVLTTSRRRLDVDGEADWNVPALGLPGIGNAALDSDAVALFAERARLVDRSFVVDEDSAAAVVDVCRCLDGMPLAATDLAREVSDPFAHGCATLLIALAECTAGRARDVHAELERIRDDVGAMRGSAVLVWAWLISAIARAADGDPDGAALQLRAIVAGEVGVCRMPQIWAHLELAEILRLAGDPDAAGHARAALTQADDFGNPWLVARAHLLRGRLAASEGRWTEADDLLHQALDAITEHRLLLELPAVLEALAQVAQGRRDAPLAARLLAAAAAFRADRSLAAWPAQRAEVDVLAARVGPGGHQPPDTVEEVIAWARRSRGRRVRPRHGWDSLTPTELTVARHAAAGSTNPQIALAMFVSQNTVKTHLAHVFDKLGITTRAELGGIAARHRDPSSANAAPSPSP